MKITGTLTIDGGISRLDGTRLMKGLVNSGGFDRATNFLQQERHLDNDDEIFVDGADDHFGEMPVIVITNAGLSTAALLGAAKGASKAMSAGRKKGLGGAVSKSAKKSSSKKSASKKSGVKGRSVKSASKKSTRKQPKK